MVVQVEHERWEERGGRVKGSLLLFLLGGGSREERCRYLWDREREGDR